MHTVAITLFVLALASCTAQEAQAVKSDEYASSYDRQQETYRKHGYDTYQNGPLPQTMEEDRRKQQRREEEQRYQERREQEDQARRDRQQEQRQNTLGELRR